MEAQPLGFWDYPLFNVVNYIIAALIWTCFGRFLLGFFLPADSKNYIWRCSVTLTDPVIRLIWYVTPKFVVEPFMPLVAAFWLFIFRFIFWRVMALMGLAPSLQALVPAG